MRRWIVQLALLFALADAGYAADDRDACFAVGGDRASNLAACARYIESGQAQGMDLSDAYFFRALYLNAGGERERALQEVSEAIRLDSSEGIITVMKLEARAELYWLKGEYDRALADLDRALKLDPKRAHSHYWRALSYAKQGDYARAAAGLQEVRKLDPNYQEPALFSANPAQDAEIIYYVSGLAYENAGELDKARLEFERVLSLNGSREDVRRRLAALGQPASTPQSPTTDASRSDVAPAAAQPSSHAVVVAAATPAGPQGPARQIFEKYGLLGIWSADCSKPATPENEYLVFRALDEQRVQNDGMVGPTERRYAVVIESAAGAGANEIILTLQDVDVRWRVEGKRMRPLERARDGGKAAVEEELWVEKCN